METFIRRGMGIVIGIFCLFASGCGTHELHSTNAVSHSGAAARKFDFGAAEAASGFTSVGIDCPYSRERGYGWVTAPDALRDRGRPDALRRDFVFSRNPATFRVDLAPGIYRVDITMGDADYGDHVLAVSVPESRTTFPELQAARNEFASMSVAFRVEASSIEFRFGSPVRNWVLNAMTIEPAAAVEEAKVSHTKEKFAEKSADLWGDVFAWPDPIAPYVAQFRKDQTAFRGFTATGLTRADYLSLIAGDVDYFKAFQNKNGAIIDPYKKVEYQYSTPCFALAAATLVVYAGRHDLIEPAAKAMDWAVYTLSRGEAATHHEDFFSCQIAHALPLLEPYVSKERYENWISELRSFDPYTTYRARCGGGNWNVVALSGEALYFLLGIRKKPDFTENCLAAQGRLFNSPWGMYTEGPMPYDLFPRIWAADMLASGYVGKDTDKLAEVLRRGALTSLFMQSPTGELPAGGRSTHHQWNEAEQCLMDEIYAGKALARGDEAVAGAFKRAAHLALASMRRWQRPSGELWIVKNRYDPAERFGYEGYSSHSQYNLLPMAMLSIAFQYAGKTESVAERPAPADVGGFVLHIPEPFNKVFANAGGMYIEIDTAADLAYNATGLLRVQRSGFNPQLGPSDALTEHAIYHLPDGPRTTTAIGPAWKGDDGVWHRLGEFGYFKHGRNIDRRSSAELRDVSERPGRVAFELVYTGDFHGPKEIVESYVITPDSVALTEKLKGYSGPVRMVWPVLAFDGQRKTEIRVDGDTVSVQLGKDTQTYDATGATSVRVGEKEYGFRNGLARVVTAEFPPTRKVALRIRPRVGQE